MKFLNETVLICSNIVPYSCEASFLWICMLFQINFYFFKLWVSELCPSNNLRSPLQSSYCHKWPPIPIEKSCHFHHLLKCGTATLNWTHSIFSSKDSNIFVLRKILILKILASYITSLWGCMRQAWWWLLTCYTYASDFLLL